LRRLDAGPAQTGQAGAFETDLARLLIATPDGGDPLVDPTVTGLLGLIREHLGMDVVFVSEFLDGANVFRRVACEADTQAMQEGDRYPLADSFCQRVVDGRLPRLVKDVAALDPSGAMQRYKFNVGAYVGVPITLADGTLYGMLCCFGFAPNPALGPRELARLEMAARLMARLLDGMTLPSA